MSERILLFSGSTIIGENVTNFFSAGTLLEIEAPNFVTPDYLEITAFLSVFTSPSTVRLLPLVGAEDNQRTFNVTSTLYAIELPYVNSAYNCSITFEMDITTPLNVYVTANDFKESQKVLDVLSSIALDKRNNPRIPLSGQINEQVPPNTPTLIFNSSTINDIMDYYLITNVSAEPLVIGLDRIPTALIYDVLIPPGETYTSTVINTNVYGLNIGIDDVKLSISAFE